MTRSASGRTNSFLATFLASTLGTICAISLLIVGVPVFFGVLLSFLGAASPESESVEKQSVLYIGLDGDVVDSPSSFQLSFSDDRPQIRLYRVLRAIKAAREDERISGVVVEFDNPSMGWASASALHRELAAVKDAKKFVFAYADQMGEKEFYVASAADKVFMQPQADLELNGLAVDETFVKGLLQKIGVQPVIFRVGKFKSAIEPLIGDQMSPENREQLQTLLNDIWGEARTRISGAAKRSPQELDAAMADLKISSVDDAKKFGLVAEGLFSDEMETLIKRSVYTEVQNLDELHDMEINWVTVPTLLADIKSKRKSKKNIAVLVAEGEIIKGEGDAGLVGDESMLEALREIRDDESIAAVVVRINSPGGSALASDIIWRELSVLDEKKPVIASMGDIAASGGYYIAAGARHIFAESTTITGSIGVFGVLFNAEGLLKDKAALKFDRVFTHPHADFGAPNRRLDADETRQIQSSVERVYTRFLDVVAQSRGFEKVDEVAPLAEGRVWSGVAAHRLKLVDEIGGLERAVNKAAEFAGVGTGFNIEYFPRRGDRFARFLDQLSEDSSSSMSGPSWSRSFAERSRALASVRTDLGGSSQILRHLVGALTPLNQLRGWAAHATEPRRWMVLARDPLSPAAIR
ncbi:MAG TPA: signal peptide peptidase SppA [Pseudobdellovibrionaceae bacterium]|nr:signal peptide peptidase SppA [Pseudobdellovibrionaceae bacterium]